MNIFYLDTDPEIAASFHCDAHRNKMLTESVQLLSTAHRVLLGRETKILSDSGRRMTRYVFDDERETAFMKSTHVNHPAAVWARSSFDNYIWLCKLVIFLNMEYKKFSGREHAAYRRMIDSGLNCAPSNVHQVPFFEPPQTMPDQYKVPGDSVTAYRNFYIHDKSRFATFKQGVPDWYTEGLLLKQNQV